MSATTALKLEDEIVERAEHDRIPEAQFAAHGIQSAVEKEAVQFLLDMKLRAGLPFEIGMEDSVRTIIDAALRISGVPPEEVVALHDLTDYGFLGLVPHRKKVLLVNINKHSGTIPDLVGKVFPRIIIFGSMTVQYTFLGQGQQVSTADAIGKALNPAVELAFIHSPYKRTETRSLLAMGVFPNLSPSGPVWSIPRTFKKNS